MAAGNAGVTVNVQNKNSSEDKPFQSSNLMEYCSNLHTTFIHSFFTLVNFYKILILPCKLFLNIFLIFRIKTVSKFGFIRDELLSSIVRRRYNSRTKMKNRKLFSNKNSNIKMRRSSPAEVSLFYFYILYVHHIP